MARDKGERVYAAVLMLTAAALVVLGITILPHRDTRAMPPGIETSAMAVSPAARPK